jgi:hypothetical protein
MSISFAETKRRISIFKGTGESNEQNTCKTDSGQNANARSYVKPIFHLHHYTANIRPVQG